MLRDIVLLSVFLAAVYCQQCNYVIASETIASEDLYFERATSTDNYTVKGFVDYLPGNRDYYSGPNLFYSEYATISNCFLNEMVKAWKCQFITPANAENKIDGIDSTNYKGLYINDETWLCTVPEGLGFVALGTSLSFAANQIFDIGRYGLMLGLVQIKKPQDVSRQLGLKAIEVKRQAKRYQLTERAFRQSIFMNTESFVADIAGNIKLHEDAKVLKGSQMPNKILAKNTLNVLIYTAGAKVLIGRQIEANPGIIISYTPQPLVKCNLQEITKGLTATNP